ncbi:MAG: CinA family protein [Woeseiaceae bacterium]
MTLLANALTRTRQKIAVAESCTGGWIAKTLTDVAGSSAWFEYGVVSYSNEAKSKLLKVRKTTLDTYGAVSEQVVREMADGVRILAHADFGIAVSGIAGPDGGSDEKPVGTVWCAWSTAAGTIAQMQRFNGDRNEVREKTVLWALRELNQSFDR